MGEQDGLLGAVVVDGSGAVLGAVTGLRLDPDDRRPRWLDLDLADGTPSTVPVLAASTDGAGRVVLPFGDTDLRSAPRPDGAVVTADLAAALLRHYGFPADIR